MKNSPIVFLILSVIGIYLFVSAPPELTTPPVDKNVSVVNVNKLFDLLSSEQSAARHLYTSKIVGPGIKSGLKFGEDWKEDGVDKGPLPALFLRSVGSELMRLDSGVGLFLGSDFPISPSNKFTSFQQKYFDEMKRSNNPAYFKDSTNNLYTAMYMDLASAKPCVSCHNDHPDTSKSDWKLNDPMGATTWTYSKSNLSLSELISHLKILRTSIRNSYAAYLDKVKTFEKEVIIGDKWPSSGLYLPSIEVFMKEFENVSSSESINNLLGLQSKK